VLCDRHGRSLAVIEAQRYSVIPGDAAAQAKAYAQQLGVPYAFLCNGDEVLFWEWQREAHPRPVKTIFKATQIYRRTKNLRAVQLLLGHSKLESTVRYLGIEVDDALEISEQTEI
jgi:type I restriction enzyme R subunit